MHAISQNDVDLMMNWVNMFTGLFAMYMLTFTRLSNTANAALSRLLVVSALKAAADMPIIDAPASSYMTACDGMQYF
jgi:hypothetical protein